MHVRFKSWAISLVIVALLLVGGWSIKPKTIVADDRVQTPVTVNPQPPMVDPAAEQLAALVEGDVFDAVLSDPLALALDEDRSSVFDSEVLVKVGEDDTPRGSLPRAIQTLTDPSLFSRFADDLLEGSPYREFETALATAPSPGDSSGDGSATLSNSVGGFDPAPTISLTGDATAVPEPASLGLFMLAAAGLAPARRTRPKPIR